VPTDKIREFNKFAVKREGKEFSDDNISLVERLVKDNEHCSAAVDVLWQMLQWPSRKSPCTITSTLQGFFAVISQPTNFTPSR